MPKVTLTPEIMLGKVGETFSTMAQVCIEEARSAQRTASETVRRAVARQDRDAVIEASRLNGRASAFKQLGEYATAQAGEFGAAARTAEKIRTTRRSIASVLELGAWLLAFFWLGWRALVPLLAVQIAEVLWHDWPPKRRAKQRAKE